jgi:hypothetical protein
MGLPKSRDFSNGGMEPSVVAVFSDRYSRLAIDHVLE